MTAQIITEQAPVPPATRPNKRVRNTLLSLLVGASLVGAGAPSSASASHVPNFGYLNCNAGATGSSAPNPNYSFNYPSTSYADAYLYRWNGYKFVYYRPANRQLERIGGTWFPQKGWTFGVPAGWYAVWVRVQTRYAWSGWIPAEGGWADTNPHNIVGDQFCQVTGYGKTSSGADQAEPTKAPPAIRRAPKSAPQSR